MSDSDIVKRMEVGAHAIAALLPEVAGATNFSPAAEGTMRAIAHTLNQILAKRLKVHFTWWSDQSSAADPDTLIQCLIRTSPNTVHELYQLGVTSLRCRMVLSAGRDDEVALPDPYVDIALHDVTKPGGGGVLKRVHNTHRDPDIGPQNFRQVEVDLHPPDAADRTYRLEVSARNLCQIVSFSLYEVPRSALDQGAGDVFVATDGFHLGGRIYDEDVRQVWELLRFAYDRKGSVFIAWSAMNSARAAVVAATLTNLWDASTAYSADSYGFYTWPLYQGTLAAPTFGIVLWAILEIEPAGSSQFLGALQWVDSAGVIGTLDVQHYDPVPSVPYVVTVALQTRWYSDPAADATRKVDILGLNAAATSMKVHACGMFAQEQTDPRAFGGLTVWLAADHITGLADGDPVATWPDSSGNGNDALQAAAGLRPLFKTNQICGRPAVRFDGVDDFMAIVESATYKTASVTVFVVARLTGTNAHNIAIGYPHDVTHTSPFFRWALDFQANPDVALIVASDVELATADFTTFNLWRVWTYVTQQRFLLRDGHTVEYVPLGGPTITYPNAVGLYIGGDVAGGQNFAGDIAEILVYGALNAPDRDRIEEMLSQKYGLQRGQL